jgi:phage FluMu protein Com
MSINSMGFEEDLVVVIDWIKSALDDGWTRVDGSSRIKKDDVVVHFRVLPTRHTRRCEAALSGYTQDGLGLLLPIPYCWDTILKNIKLCSRCHKTVDKVVRLGFAERVCPACREQHAPTVEAEGWTN